MCRTGILLKFRPLNSESESSIYSKSELCADNESKVQLGLFSERNEKSFWLVEEMEVIIISINISIRGREGNARRNYIFRNTSV